MCQACGRFLFSEETSESLCLKEDTVDGVDSWSNWHPDPELAFFEHDSKIEPYASMTKQEILDAMVEARGGREWERLREFLLDKCSPEELLYSRFLELFQGSIANLSEFLLVNEIAGMATRHRASAKKPTPNATEESSHYY